MILEEQKGNVNRCYIERFWRKVLFLRTSSLRSYQSCYAEIKHTLWRSSLKKESSPD